MSTSDIGGPTFSANLGFLWTDLPLPQAIRQAAAAGFPAVECHQPFGDDPSTVLGALQEVGLPMITLNTGVGDPDAGELGLTAIPGRETDARRLIDQAIDYAAVIDCRFVSVVAGHSGRTPEAEATYRDNLTYAAERAATVGVGVLIEPLNTVVGEGYHLVRVADAVETVRAVGAANLSIMADTFHVMTMDGDLSVIEDSLQHIGHIQISGWPDRAEPDHGIDFATWIPQLIAAGYQGGFGAEYTPNQTVEAGLSWLDAWQKGGMQ